MSRETTDAADEAEHRLYEREERSDTSERQRLTARKIDMLHDDVPVAKIFKQLFGYDPEIDEVTGELKRRPGR